MLACTLAALVAVPVRAPGIVRPPMTVVLGVLLGASFSADLIGQMAAWVSTLLGLTLFLLVSGAACVVYFRTIGGNDLPTAYFAGMPGGLMEMVLLGQARGGDARRIALVHAIRIPLTVVSLPFLIPALGGGDIGTGRGAGGPINAASLDSVLWLVATGVVVAALGRLLKLPAPILLGPMIASGFVHMIGWTHSSPPREIVWIAQLVLGTTLGCRFVGTTPREMLRMVVLSLGAFAILIVSAVGFAIALAALTPLDVVSIAPAYSPGGLVETSVIALALQIEAAFVATHHIVRVILIMAAAEPIFRLVGRLRRK
ncbi:AbrB family transcriptional regulator [Aurantimonas aggregata]|uniref:AbrB family transcriptional regulator n=2 Tax=Aurantimonas aggregata TaxID=2047720 RepID=A0A6L9MP35_9HYPH|nr:AbrB family transcriptional regulator [Aurantimonas aggregata]